MMSADSTARAVAGEVLPPLPWHEGAGYLAPVVVLVRYARPSQRHFVTLEDGGVWSLRDADLATIDRDDVAANASEIFARWPEKFRFVRRVAPRYLARSNR